MLNSHDCIVRNGVQFLISLLEDRIIFAEIKDSSTTRHSKKALSTWIALISSLMSPASALLRKIKIIDCEVVAYANDIAR